MGRTRVPRWRGTNSFRWSDLPTNVVLQSDESHDTFESLLSKEEQELQTSDNMSMFIRGKS